MNRQGEIKKKILFNKICYVIPKVSTDGSTEMKIFHPSPSPQPSENSTTKTRHRGDFSRGSEFSKIKNKLFPMSYIEVVDTYDEY